VKEDICIIYFSRRPEEEQAFKKLYESKNVSNLLIKAMYEHGLETIKRTGYDYICYHEDRQSGNTFGERIANAIDETFLTYQNVIIIGNDCPNLNIKDIHFAASSLSSEQFCLGLTNKGGTYLIGLSKAKWNRKKFIHLPWNTTKIAGALMDYLAGIGQIILLDRKKELNHIEDVELYLSSAPKTALWLTMTMLSKNKQKRISNSQSYSKEPIHQFYLFRGPPASYSVF
jgi:glycosyltransferase A (GT-A) superfamily protein (DUF2064 family)